MTAFQYLKSRQLSYLLVNSWQWWAMEFGWSPAMSCKILQTDLWNLTRYSADIVCSVRNMLLHLLFLFNRLQSRNSLKQPSWWWWWGT